MSSIRIVCMRDTHGRHFQLDLPDGDILVHAGDFMTFGDKPKEIVSFNRWLGQLPHRHKVVIAGNHDRMFESQPGAAKALLTNAIYLENSGIAWKASCSGDLPCSLSSTTERSMLSLDQTFFATGN